MSTSKLHTRARLGKKKKQVGYPKDNEKLTQEENKLWLGQGKKS